jgi:hypothetical protein
MDIKIAEDAKQEEMDSYKGSIKESKRSHDKFAKDAKPQYSDSYKGSIKESKHSHSKFAKDAEPQEMDSYKGSKRSSDKLAKAAKPQEMDSYKGSKRSSDKLAKVAKPEEMDSYQGSFKEPRRFTPTELSESEPEPEEEESMVEIQDDNWNSGLFQVNIIRCSNCHYHFDYCRHSEDEFIDMFNDVGDDISDKFPEVEIIGNHERPSELGCCDVYVRGIGPMHERDSQGRYFIYRHKYDHKANSAKAKMAKSKMPKSTKRDILDTLIILSLLYGNSKKLGEAQKDFKRNYAYLIPNPISEMHDYPAKMHKYIRRQPILEKESKAKTDRVMVCKHWACGSEFNEEKNEKNSCTYHPGVYQFGSRNGLWPESWTCCRKEWTEMGCRRGFHRGEPKETILKLCINHGEPNKKLMFPDSFCGKPFREQVQKPEWQMTDEEKQALLQCHIHTGYFNVDLKKGPIQWTCCQEDASAPPCWEGPHNSADFPEEEAKKYFYDKPLKQVGNYGHQNSFASEFEHYGRFCGIFKIHQPYVAKNPPEKIIISKDEQKKLDMLDRV